MLFIVLIVLESRIKKYDFKLNYIIESLKIFFFSKIVISRNIKSISLINQENALRNNFSHLFVLDDDSAEVNVPL
jgi:hypothetical protein